MASVTVWVVVNPSGVVWGGDAYLSEEVARTELTNFFRDKKVSDKFEIREIPVHYEPTGQYAGEGKMTPPDKSLRMSRWHP